MRLIFKQVLHTQLFSVLTIFMGFATLLLLMKYMDVSDYGQYVLIQGFIAFSGIVVSQNLYTYARMKIPGELKSNQYGYLKTVICLVFGLNFVFLLFAELIFKPGFASLFEINIDYVSAVLMIFSVQILIDELIRFLIAIKKIQIKNYVNFLQKFFILVAVLWSLYNQQENLKLDSFLELYLYGQILVLIFIVFFVEIRELVTAKFMSDVVIQGYKIAIPLIPIGLMSIALSYTDTFMIAKLIDLESVAQYGFASQVISIGMMLIGTSIVLTVFPYVTEAYNNNKNKDVGRMFSLMYLCSVLLSMLFFAGLTNNLSLFLSLINLEKYAPSVDYLIIMGIFPVFQSIFNVAAHKLQLERKIKVQVYVSMFIVLLNVVLNYLGIMVFGVYGAIAASLCAYILLSFLYIKISKDERFIYEFFLKNKELRLVFIIAFFVLIVLPVSIDRLDVKYVILSNVVMISFVLFAGFFLKNKFRLLI